MKDQIKLEPEFRIVSQDLDMEPDPQYIPQELHHFTRYRYYVSKKHKKNTKSFLNFHQDLTVCLFLCMYVINIYLVSAPLRAFSGALYELFQMNVTYPLLLNRCVIDQFFEHVTVQTYCGAYRCGACGQFIPGIIGPATENPRRCIAVDRQQETTRLNNSA